MHRNGSFSGSTYFSADGLPPALLADENQSSGLSPAVNDQDYVLIFSRESDTRCLLKLLLEQWGYRIETSESLEDSFSIISRQPPVIILLDSVLPFKANLETIRRMRRERLFKHIPIALLSGFSQPECRHLSLESGADDFFVKPLDFERLENFLDNKIGVKRGN